MLSKELPPELAGRVEHTPQENFARGLLFIDLRAVPGVTYLGSGKVRDLYRYKGIFIEATTDRTSSFDSNICTIPGKGQYLNKFSTYWKDLIKVSILDTIHTDHIALPHTNIVFAKEAVETVGVEVVARSHMVESASSTAVGKHYADGERTIYGIEFPDGLRPNERFPMGPIITPTTKAATGRDQMLTGEQAYRLVDNLHGWGVWDTICEKALRVFTLMSQVCEKRGLIIPDTKFEFGFDATGQLMLIDEVGTSDSSRFWFADDYEERFKRGKPPRQLSKEALRVYLAEHGYKGEGRIPTIPAEVIDQMIPAYEIPYRIITGAELPVADTSPAAMQQAVQEGLAALQQ